jgi:hypothetical protein
MMRRFWAMAIFGALSLSLLTGCMQQINELAVFVSGTSIPWNDRERLIFDYFSALRDRRCEAAYGMWAGSNSIPNSHDYFIQKCMAGAGFPVRISIGKEKPISGEPCGYGYIVYVADRGGKQMYSGELGLRENPKKPGSCQVAYNSAFGPM